MFAHCRNITTESGLQLTLGILSNLKVFNGALPNVSPSSVAHLTNCDRPKTLGLESLELWRLGYDLIMLYKIVHYLMDLDWDSLNTSSSSTVTRNSLLKIFKPTSLSSACKFLCVRSNNAWNFLSDEIWAAQSISYFKRNLTSHNLSKFIKSCWCRYYCSHLFVKS